MAKTKVRLKSSGVVALLNDPRMVAYMQSQMATVRAVYGPAHIETKRHGDRTVVQVWSDKPNSFYREAHGGQLARAFGRITG